MTHETDAIVARIMSIRNGMMVDADAEALIRDALDARQTSPVSRLGRESVAKAIYEAEPFYEPGEYVDGFAVSPGGDLSWEEAKQRDAEFGNDPMFCKITDFAYRAADRVIGLAPTPADGLAKLIADKAAEPAFVEFAKNMPQLNEALYLPIFKVGPTAVTHWRVALMSGREIGLSDDELKTAVSQSSTDREGK